MDEATRRNVMLSALAGAGALGTGTAWAGSGRRAGKTFKVTIRSDQVGSAGRGDNRTNVLAGRIAGTLGPGALALGTRHPYKSDCGKAPILVRVFTEEGALRCRITLSDGNELTDGSTQVQGLGTILSGTEGLEGAKGRFKLNGARASDGPATFTVTGTFSA